VSIELEVVSSRNYLKLELFMELPVTPKKRELEVVSHYYPKLAATDEFGLPSRSDYTA
jgi:hypothetical protein